MKCSRIPQLLLALFLAAVLAAEGPAAAGPLAQTGGTVTYRRPAWDLSLRYPAGWQVSEQGEVAAISTSTTEGGAISDAAALVLVRDAYYADPDLTLEEVLLDVTDQISSPLDQVAVEELEGTEISGQAARTASYTATDRASGLPLTGKVLQFGAGESAFALVATALAETWDAHADQFEAMLASIKAGQAGPTATPTRRRRAAPTPTEEVEPVEEPTEEPVATEEPEATATAAAVEGVYVTAREAYDLALPVAQEWNHLAALVSATCLSQDIPLADPNADTCPHWYMEFTDNPDDPGQADGLALVVANGRVDPESAGSADVSESAPVGEDWLDSADALQAYLDNGGGAGFLERYPEALIGLMRLGQLDVDQPVTWQIGAVATPADGQRLTWASSLEPASGTVEASSDEAGKKAARYTAARQALGLVRKDVEKWDKNAALTRVFGVVKSNEPGYAAGKVGEWDFYFLSDSGVRRIFTLSGAKVDSTLSLVERAAIDGEWLDSAAVLKKLRALPDYAAFVKMYPKPALYFNLEVDEEAGLIWGLTAELPGGSLSLELIGAQALAAPAGG